jgi:hypothetical protein
MSLRRGHRDATAEFTAIRVSIQRHVAWAEELVAVGEYADASEAMLDAEALAAELRDAHEPRSAPRFAR